VAIVRAYSGRSNGRRIPPGGLVWRALRQAGRARGRAAPPGRTALTLAIWWTVVTVAVAADPSLSSEAPAGAPDARSLLGRCVESQSRANRISIRGATEKLFAGPEGKRKITSTRREYWLRRDGNLLDISGSDIRMSGNVETVFAKFRHVTRQDMDIKYEFRPPRGQTRPDGGIAYQKDVERMRKHVISGPLYGTALDGYFSGGDGKRAAEVLLAAQNATIARQETIDGVPCSVVEGRTPYGRISLWIARSQDCIPRRVVIQRV